MNRKVLVVVGVILLSLASCCGVCMVAGLLSEPAGAPGLDDSPSGAAASGADGRFTCVQMGRIMSGGMLMVTTNPSISFTIDGARFSTPGGGGDVRREGNVLHFSGSDMNGWQGTLSPSGTLMYFRADPTQRHPGGGANGNGELKCDRRP